MTINVKDYGWISSEASACNDFISPKIIQICSELGVRRILDIGCGNGVVSAHFVKSGFYVNCYSEKKVFKLQNNLFLV